jgi:hypothetical protein
MSFHSADHCLEAIRDRLFRRAFVSIRGVPGGRTSRVRTPPASTHDADWLLRSKSLGRSYSRAEARGNDRNEIEDEERANY